MKIITANRLADGRVIYWTQGRGWSDDIGRAMTLEDDAAESELSLALADEKTEVVAPYLIDVDGGRPAGRERLKESIRLEGPTTGTSKRLREEAH